MANRRAVGKKLIGAQASAELWAGVDAWLIKNPNATVSDFVLRACIEKLIREGIAIDPGEALRDRRGRSPAVFRPQGHPKYKMPPQPTAPGALRKQP